MNGLTLSWKRIFAQWNTEHKIFTNSLQYLLNLCTHENPQSKHRIFLIERCPWYIQDFPGISASKESTCNAGNPGSIPGSGRSPGEGNGYPLQYSWTSHEAQLVKNPLQCGGLGFNPRVGKIPWRRKWLPTPVFWPGEFHGLYSSWGHKESDTTERLSLHTCCIQLIPHKLCMPPMKWHLGDSRCEPIAYLYQKVEWLFISAHL